MFDGIPFRGACWVMGDCYGEAVRVGQLGLYFGFPGAGAAAIAAAAVGQNQELTRVWIAEGSFLSPPMSDGMHGESRSVVRDANEKGAAVGAQIVDAIRDGEPVEWERKSWS